MNIIQELEASVNLEADRRSINLILLLINKREVDSDLFNYIDLKLKRHRFISKYNKDLIECSNEEFDSKLIEINKAIKIARGRYYNAKRNNK